VLGLVAVAFAFVLAAVDFLPFLGYVESSPRGRVVGRDYAFATQFSMPPSETIGVAVPEQHGVLDSYRGPNAFKLHTEYVGALVLVMLLVGLAVARREAYWRFFAALGAFGLTLSYGSYTPLYRLYHAALPGLQRFRAPTIAFSLVSFALVAMAGLALERLAAQRSAGVVAPVRRDAREPSGLTRYLTLLAGCAVVAFLLSLVAATDGNPVGVGWGRFTLFVAAVVLVVRFWFSERLGSGLAASLLAVLTVVDLSIVGRQFLLLQPPPDQLFAADDVVGFLRTREPGRVWVFPFPEEDRSARYLGNRVFGVRSNYLMHFGLRQAGGEHGNQLQRWNDYVGVDRSNLIDWHNFVERPSFLNAAGIRYIVSGVEMQLVDVAERRGVEGMRQAYRGSAFVYENADALPRAALVPVVTTVRSGAEAMSRMRSGQWDPRREAIVETSSPMIASGGEPEGSTQLIADEPSHVHIRTTSRANALLVLTDNYEAGWEARIDGRTAPILRTNYAFRGVAVPGGTHDVIFRYRPRALYRGLYLSIGSWLALAGVALLLRRRSRTARLAEGSLATT
jgi:hypothetical protein